MRISFIAAILFALTSTAAFAQNVQRPGGCFLYPELVQKLKSVGESLLGRGIGRDRRTVIEVYTSPGGAFTVVQVRTNGYGCIKAFGHGWQAGAPGEPT